METNFKVPHNRLPEEAEEYIHKQQTSIESAAIPAYMGVAEVCEYLGVSKQVVSNWYHRGSKNGFPSAYAELALGPIWKTCDIAEFRRKRDEKLIAQANRPEDQPDSPQSENSKD